MYILHNYPLSSSLISPFLQQNVYHVTEADPMSIITPQNVADEDDPEKNSCLPKKNATSLSIYRNPK